MTQSPQAPEGQAETCKNCGRAKATEITKYGSCVPDDGCGWHLVAGRHSSDGSTWLANCYGHALCKLRLELEAAHKRIAELEAPPVYPDTMPNAEYGPQHLRQPVAVIFGEVAPSGYFETVWDSYSPRYPCNRKVRYVLAAPNEGDD